MIDPSASSEDRTWALAAHLIGMVAGWVVPVIGNIAGPLIIYAINKDRSRFVAFHALQATYWALAIIVGGLVCGFMIITVILALVGIPLLFILGIAGLVYGILGAINAYNGKLWEYPIVGAAARQTVGI